MTWTWDEIKCDWLLGHRLQTVRKSRSKLSTGSTRCLGEIGLRPLAGPRVPSDPAEAQSGRCPDQLGIVYLSFDQPGTVELQDHGRPYTPRLGLATSLGEGGGPVRHLAVRVSYFDHRAHHFLAKEAAQLPDTDPGLIMIGMSGAPGDEEMGFAEASALG